ncbi:DUF2690 domain-containing protein [Nonomuraea sp. NPDC005983]|uniref:DUF2690 domain-containing protein n=1 Tax=Nonomuraea sp. NPDC005983 TaxID=3155595 RepID=UPI0033A814FA
MKFRVTATAVGAIAAALLATSPAQAAAKPYDHKDPYKTGCGNSARAVRTGIMKSRIEPNIGTIKLMWSGTCKTNWIEIKTMTAGYGTINVYTQDGREDRFSYRAGNGGRHWGNMLYGNDMCAWGSASVSWNGGMGGQSGSGGTPKACK